jgi:hypothetical protein
MIYAQGAFGRARFSDEKTPEVTRIAKRGGMIL